MRWSRYPWCLWWIRNDFELLVWQVHQSTINFKICGTIENLFSKKLKKLWKNRGKSEGKMGKSEAKEEKVSRKKGFPVYSKKSSIAPWEKCLPWIFTLYRRGMIRVYSVPQSACTQTLEAWPGCKSWARVPTNLSFDYFCSSWKRNSSKTITHGIYIRR